MTSQCKSIKYILLVRLILLINNFNINAEVVLERYEYNLSNYNIIGNKSNIQLDSNISYSGKKSVRLGGSDLKMQRKITAEPNAIFVFNSFAKVNNKNIDNNIYIALEYYDNYGKIINEFKSYVQDTVWQKYEISMVTPPHAKYLILSFNYKHDTLNNIVYFDDSYWNTNSMQIIESKEYDLQKYLYPFWATDTIYDEAILMISYNKQLPKAKILYSPKEIIKIYNSYLQQNYTIDKEYTTNDNDIICQNYNDIPFYHDTVFNKKQYWYILYYNENMNYPQWVNVTYKCNRIWNGPKIISKTDLLNNTYEKLKNKDSLKIAIIGNSIVRGMNVSGMINYYPHMGSYFTLFSEYLKSYYDNNKITYYDMSLPGAIAKQFGVEAFNNYIKPINPDLLIIDFGMADFWGTNPKEFKNAISAIIDSVKMYNKNCDVIVISEMKFDPNYLNDTNDVYFKTCHQNIKGYQSELANLEKIGIANIDMYTISDSLQKWKKPKDLLVDPVHPNDYMARWYAQSLISALVPVMSGSINKIVNRSNQLVLDNMESKLSQSQVETSEIIIGNHQDWEFYKLANGNNRVLSNDSKLALAFENGDLIQTIIKDTSSQEWELIPLDNQFYKLKNIANQQYLTIDTISNKIAFQPLNNNPAQEWNIYYSYKKEELNTDKDTTYIESSIDSTHFIQIESNTKWNVTKSAKWLHFDKNEGNGNRALKIIIDENIDKKQREATIDITTNELTKRHYVIQNGSKTSIIDSAKENTKLTIISPTKNDNNIYLICENCLNSILEIELFDLIGRLVYKRNYPQYSQVIKIETNNLQSSQYIIKVSNSEQTIIEKVVIAK